MELRVMHSKTTLDEPKRRICEREAEWNVIVRSTERCVPILTLDKPPRLHLQHFIKRFQDDHKYSQYGWPPLYGSNFSID